MNFVEHFKTNFLGYEIDLIVDSDTPPPIDWDRLLPMKFTKGKSTTADIAFRLEVRNASCENDVVIRLPFFKKKRTVLWSRPGRRIVIGDQAQILIKTPFLSAILSGPSRWHFVSELLDSWIGWQVERRGFVRLHGLAVENQKRVSILVAREGFGKTTLALKCRENAISVLGEEVLFLKNRIIYPVRTVLREKTENGDYDGPFGRRQLHVIDRPHSGGAAIDTIFYGIRLKERERVIAWLLSCKLDILIGLGLPQNLDLTFFPFSITSIAGWFRIFRNRFVLVTELRKLRCEPFLRRSAQSPIQTATNWFRATSPLTK